MKRWLADNLGKTDVEGITRRELFRLAATHKLIDSVDDWIFYHQARNQTSHSYDEVAANEIFSAAQIFTQHANLLLTRLTKKMIDLASDQLKKVQIILESLVPNTSVWAFGSRVHMTANKHSDLDIVGEQKLPKNFFIN